MSTSTGENPRSAQILKVAAELFDSRGYHATSMDAIAKRLGLRKASLYYYFKGKDEILTKLHEELMETVTQRHLERSSDPSLAPVTLLRGMLGDVIGLMESHPGYLRVFLENFRELPLDVRRSVADMRANYRRMMVDIIKDGIEDGSISPDTDEEMAALAMLSLTNYTYQWFRVDGRLDAEGVADQFWKMIFNGISA